MAYGQEDSNRAVPHFVLRFNNKDVNSKPSRNIEREGGQRRYLGRGEIVITRARGGKGGCDLRVGRGINSATSSDDIHLQSDHQGLLCRPGRLDWGIQYQGTFYKTESVTEM